MGDEEAVSAGSKVQNKLNPADTRRLLVINVDLMLIQRRRRWTNVKPTLRPRHGSAGDKSSLYLSN